MRKTASAFCLVCLLHLQGCVKQRCYEKADCPEPKVCGSTGTCVFECSEDRDCGSGFICVDHLCKVEAKKPVVCPEEMVKIADTFCIDRYEASRPDATETSAGIDDSCARSVKGVLPWQVSDNSEAENACRASGKRLCTAEQWQLACKGPDDTVYAYGNDYDPEICNGIDTFGRGNYHLMPTGSFSGCTNEWGVFDINGNLWEHISGGSDMTVRGGAYNCIDSATLHRCDYVPGSWTPSALGFRCCLVPDAGDGGRSASGLEGAAAAGDSGAADSGCLENPDSSNGMDSGRVKNPDGANPVQDAACVRDSPSSSMDSDLFGDGNGAECNDAGDSGPVQGCPPGMVAVGDFCIDIYEASRQDATATTPGSDESVAVSRAGVLPWYVNPMSSAALAKFQAACQAAGKRLCGAIEWFDSCRGPAGNTYFFSNTWDPSACNSLDTYCRNCCDILGLSSCPTAENCGYSSALSSSPYTPETCFITADYGLTTCHVCFHVMPTGSFSQCTNDLGLYDVNGNVWEVVPVSTAEDSRGYQVRGGAFNCGSPSLRFQCGFNATWDDLYAGFRCCKDRS